MTRKKAFAMLNWWLHKSKYADELQDWKGLIKPCRKNEMAYCNSSGKTIVLDDMYVIHNSEKHIRGTIKHELAHALNYERNGILNGHGKEFRAICRDIGADSRAVSICKTPKRK